MDGRAGESCAVTRISTFDPAHGEQTMELRVAGEESVEIGGRRRNVVAVDAKYGTHTARLYVDPATRREVGWTARRPDGAVMHGVSRDADGR